MDGLRRLEVFARVAELESFTAAGRALGVTQSQASRAVRDLEHDVGAQLLSRSTRRVSLTREGRRYLAGARDALRALAAAGDEVREGGRSVSGLLRVTAPVEFGEYIAPVLLGLLASHPGLRVDCALADRVVDLLDEGFDVGVRFGPLAPSTLRARRLGAGESALCAAPAYLKRRGAPRSPADLGEHDVILFAGKRAEGRLDLVDRRGRAAQVRASGRLRVNDLRMVRLAALDGAGVAALPLAMAREALEAGRLAAVLPGWAPRPFTVHAVFPPREPQPARLTAFLDAMAAALRAARGRTPSAPAAPRH